MTGLTAATLVAVGGIELTSELKTLLTEVGMLEETLLNNDEPIWLAALLD